jgi:hypothetical protein
MIIRIDELLNATLPTLATKAEMMEGFGRIHAELARRPTIGAMRAMGIALFALTVTAFAGGAVLLP